VQEGRTSADGLSRRALRGERLDPCASAPAAGGYHWVRSDNGDYLLVAITTGLIASIIAATH
jgi:hypothetical protein